MNRMESGGYVYGPSRFGKSRGIKWFVRTALEERFGFSVPLVVWVRRPDMHVSETEFWRDLLLASNFLFTNEPQRIRTRGGLRDLFRSRMVTLAKSAQSNYVVLLIDEAQDMTLREWQWLLGLQNVLDYDGFRLSVFSIGTQQIGYQHDYLAKSGNAHIAARFFVLHSKFHGIRGRDELRFVLDGYDRESEWPDGSGASYLQHFSPEFFSMKKRLADCTDTLWRALEDLLPVDIRRRFERDEKEVEVPMKHVALSVEEALWHLADGEEWDNVTSYESWNQIIARTGFQGHMRAIAHLG
ncbi:ATP-binding protein [Castellaniella defragrans]|uniref:ATP-binding protein n=1 Tax=Castellaniella defragrans TaxID=75697 RepID=UPI002B003E14|nr:ATP-binding protein [Castellaniella defragrans]